MNKISNEDLFKKIINLISTKLTADPKEKLITDRLTKFYVTAGDVFRSSAECQKILTEISGELTSNAKSVFKIIEELVNILKSHKPIVERKRITATMIEPPTPIPVEIITLDDRPSSSVIPKSVSKIDLRSGIILAAGSNSNGTPAAVTNGSVRPMTDSQQRRKQKLIEKYESILWEITQEINKQGEKEIGISDEGEENSAFMILEKLEAKAYQVEKNLKLLKNELFRCGRPCDKILKFVGSGHESVDKAITKFINKPKRQTKQKSSPLAIIVHPPTSYKFPDRNDVDTIIKEQNLNLNETEKDELAVKVTKKVVKMLQKKVYEERRQMVADWQWVQNPTLDVTDPAKEDKSLSEQLEKNAAEAKIALQALATANLENGNDGQQGEDHDEQQTGEPDGQQTEQPFADEHPPQPDDPEQNDSLIEIDEDSINAEQLPAVSSKRKSSESDAHANENSIKKQKVYDEIIDISDSPISEVIEIPDDDD